METGLEGVPACLAALAGMLMAANQCLAFAAMTGCGVIDMTTEVHSGAYSLGLNTVYSHLPLQIYACMFLYESSALRA